MQKSSLISSSVLHEDDVVLICLRLSAAKQQPTTRLSQRYIATLAAAGQPMNEYTKTANFTKALEHDPQGREAAMSFVREHPLMAGRTFVALIAIAILHTPTIVLTTASLGWIC